MADLYVRSTDGNNADNGSTWALAEADIYTPTWSAGDRIFVSQAHVPAAVAAAITVALAGTIASPTQLICAQDGGGTPAEPPTTLATAATTSTSGNNAISITGQCYVYGISFVAGSGATGSTAGISLGSSTGDHQVFDNCNFELGTTSASPSITAPTATATGSDCLCEWRNCTVKFNNASQDITAGRGLLRWFGGGLASGGTSPTNLFMAGSTAYRSDVEIDGISLTNANAGINLFVAGTGGGKRVIRNSRLPNSWSGVLVSGTLTTGERYELYNCDDDTGANYRVQVQDYCGRLDEETTIVVTGGASDGTTTIAWKMVTTAEAEWPVNRFESPEIVIWNTTVSGTLTVSLDIIHSGVGAGGSGDFQNDEIWLECSYLGTTGSTQSTRVSGEMVLLGTPADHANPSTTWTNSPATPVKQTLSVSVAPRVAGYLIAKVVMAKASKTVYVNPKLTVA